MLPSKHLLTSLPAPRHQAAGPVRGHIPSFVRPRTHEIFGDPHLHFMYSSRSRRLRRLCLMQALQTCVRVTRSRSASQARLVGEAQSVLLVLIGMMILSMIWSFIDHRHLAQSVRKACPGTHPSWCDGGGRTACYCDARCQQTRSSQREVNKQEDVIETQLYRALRRSMRSLALRCWDEVHLAARHAAVGQAPRHHHLNKPCSPRCAVKASPKLMDIFASFLATND